MPRSRRVLLFAVAALAVGAVLRVGMAGIELLLERKLREKLVSEAAERGFTLSVDRVTVRLPFRAGLTGVRVTGREALVRLERVDVRVGLRCRRRRAAGPSRGREPPSSSRAFRAKVASRSSGRGGAPFA